MQESETSEGREAAGGPDLLEVEGARPWCLRCRRPGSTCLCAHIEPVVVRTRFVFLMHPKEAKRIKNGSGRLAHLSLPGSELLVGVDFRRHPRVRALLADPELECQLLYPSAPGIPEVDLGSPLVKAPVLFVLDATWPCAKQMARVNTHIHRLPHISFPAGRPSEFLIKQQPDPRCLATIEAVDRTLHLLAAAGRERYGVEESARLLRPFREMVAMGLEHAADPSKPSYRRTGPYKRPEERVRPRRTLRAGRQITYQG